MPDVSIYSIEMLLWASARKQIPRKGMIVRIVRRRMTHIAHAISRNDRNSAPATIYVQRYIP
jgi:hypothetical protein